MQQPAPRKGKDSYPPPCRRTWGGTERERQGQGKKEETNQPAVRVNRAAIARQSWLRASWHPRQQVNGIYHSSVLIRKGEAQKLLGAGNFFLALSSKTTVSRRDFNREHGVVMSSVHSSGLGASAGACFTRLVLRKLQGNSQRNECVKERFHNERS